LTRGVAAFAAAPLTVCGMPLALFDLDNMLIDRNGAFLRWAREVAGTRALPDGAVEWLVEADGDGFVPREVLLGAAAQRFGLRGSVEDMHVAYKARMPDLVTVRLASTGWPDCAPRGGGSAS
jgi:hypothetical protein